MGKMIAVCGGPYSGKTTTALKLAETVYRYKKDAKVLFLSPELSVPTLGVLFPCLKDAELHSVGVALDKTDICKEDVMKQFVNVKDMRNFAFLGFKLGENKYSYPQPTKDKIEQFFCAIRDTADYIIVDCSCDDDELISRLAKRDCDTAVQIINPDIRSAVYYLSCVNEFVPIEGKKIKVLNVMDNDIYLPVEDFKAKNGNIEFTIPYSRALKQQMITGSLSEKISDPKYEAVILEIAKRVM